MIPVLELDSTPPPIDNAITAQPAPLPPPPADSMPKQGKAAAAAERIAGGLWNWVLPGMFLLSLFVLVLFTTPYLAYHWQLIHAQADAEAVFLKRRAELKAEAEHADQRLEQLDKRVHLASLGFREVARKVLPNVVNITNYREPTAKDVDLAERKRMRLIFDPDDDKKYVQQGVGSGVIYRPGVILTNWHVLRDAKRLRVIFASGRSIGVDIEQTAVDQRTDLAVIKLPDTIPPALQEEAKNVAQFCDSDKDVQVGDFALAMGSPHDLRQTVTQGIISAKGRLLSLDDVNLAELIQTDAPINKGNSGGPLFDHLGRVMGINVAIVSDNGGNQGIGFAIPSNTARKIGDLLATKGEVPRGYLGIAMNELPGPEVKALKIDGGAIKVGEVIEGEAADKAGIVVGDVIVAVNKEPLSRFEPVRHFRQLVADLEPGAEVTLEVIRDDQRRPIRVTLGKRPMNLR